MKTLFLSLNKNFFLSTAGNFVVISYDLLNDICYEIGAELTFMVKDDTLKDKARLVTDFKASRPEDYVTMASMLNTLFAKALLAPSIQDEIMISLPESYIDWLTYHSDRVYAEIGRKLREKNGQITLCVSDIYEDYIVNKLLPKIKETVCADNDIQKFTIEGIETSDITLVEIITNMRTNLTFEAWSGSWVTCELGYAFYKGIGVTKNDKISTEYYIKAADQNNSVAVNWLGYCYQCGIGIDVDYKKAMYWYKKGEELGNVYSTANIGWCIHHGLGVDIDYAAAVEHYKPGAEANIPWAQEQLANIYYEGHLGTPDYISAAKYYTMCSNIQPMSKFRMGLMILKNQIEGFDLKKSYEYLCNAADGGVNEAYYYLVDFVGEISVSGEYIKKTVDYLSANSKAGEDRASIALARLFSIANQLAEKAIDVLKIPVEKKIGEAQYELARILWENKDVAVKYTQYSVDELIDAAIAQGYNKNNKAVELKDQITKARAEEAERIRLEKLAEEQKRIEEERRLEAKRQEELRKKEEEEHRLEAERQEALRKKEEEERRLEAERQEALRKKEEEERRIEAERQETLRKKEEEKRRLAAERQEKERIEKEKEQKRRLEAQAKHAQITELEDQHRQVMQAIELFYGIGGQTDDALELELLVGPARAGNRWAMAYLGYMLLMRNPRNNKAWELIQKSIEPCENDTYRKLEELHDIRTESEKKLFYGDLRFAAHSDCLAIIGTCYLNGFGTTKDIDKAVEYFIKSSDLGNFGYYGHYQLGMCYYNGTGIIKDKNEAVKHLEIAIGTFDHIIKDKIPRFKVAGAFYALACMGYNVEKNLKTAAEQTSAFACIKWANCLYSKGKKAEAERWLHKAIEYSCGNNNVISKAQDRLREIGGRVISYKAKPEPTVYFDEIGPTLERPANYVEPAPTVEGPTIPVPPVPTPPTPKPQNPDNAKENRGFFSKLFGRK